MASCEQGVIMLGFVKLPRITTVKWSGMFSDWASEQSFVHISTSWQPVIQLFFKEMYWIENTIWELASFTK